MHCECTSMATSSPTMNRDKQKSILSRGSSPASRTQGKSAALGAHGSMYLKTTAGGVNDCATPFSTCARASIEPALHRSSLCDADTHPSLNTVSPTQATLHDPSSLIPPTTTPGPSPLLTSTTHHGLQHTHLHSDKDCQNSFGHAT